MAAVALLASGACKSDNKVGDKSLLDFKDQAQTRLGETTTTTAAATTTTAKGAVTTTTKPKAGAATTTTVKVGTAGTATTATTAPKAGPTVREISIYSDEDPNQPDPLEPKVQTAFVGSIVRWINKDKVPRGVRADSGQFASPMIQPGASWDYTAGTVGVFTYTDEDRPYVQGELRVSKP
jgi:hypothetical protein